MKSAQADIRLRHQASSNLQCATERDIHGQQGPNPICRYRARLAVPGVARHGSLQYPLPDQIRPIRASAEIDPLETHILDKDGRMLLQLPPEGTALIELV